MRPGRTQVGAVTFSDAPQLRFGLDAHQYAHSAVQVRNRPARDRASERSCLWTCVRGAVCGSTPLYHK